MVYILAQQKIKAFRMKYELSERIILQNLTPEKRFSGICPLCAFCDEPELCNKFTCEIKDAQNNNELIRITWQPKKVDSDGQKVFSNKFLDYARKMSKERVREISKQVIIKNIVNQDTK